MPVQVIQVLAKGADVMNCKPSSQAPHRRAQLVLAEIDLRRAFEMIQNLLNFPFGLGIGHGMLELFDCGCQIRVGVDTAQFHGYFFRRKDKIHRTGRDRAVGHAAILSRSFILAKSSSEPAFDCPNSMRAIGCGPGQHDANGIGPLVRCQRFEKQVNRIVRFGTLDRGARCSVPFSITITVFGGIT